MKFVLIILITAGRYPTKTANIHTVDFETKETCETMRERLSSNAFTTQQVYIYSECFKR